jgi:ADP-heptose:LPS heptosyltransferase
VKVRTTQIVDYWIGVPLCALLSIVEFFRAQILSIANIVINRSRKRVVPIRGKRILFLELSEMGSAIIAHSALAHTKKLYPDAELYFMVFSKNRESVSLLELIPTQNLILVDASNFSRFALSAVRSIFHLRELGIDTVIDLELFSRFTAMVSYLSGASTRIGFHNYTAEGLYRGNLLTHKVFYNPHQHMEYNFLALVRALLAPNGQTPLLKEDVRSFSIPLPEHTPTLKETTALWNLLRHENRSISDTSRILVLNPDPGDALPIRGWPMEKYIATIRQLLAINDNLYVVVIGLKGSKPYALQLQEVLGRERIIDLTGKTKTLRDVVTLFTLSDLLITNDSGPAHFAALTKISSIALFGPETPVLYGAIGKNKVNLFANYSCSPCLSAHNHRHTLCKESLCLQAIDVAQVVSTAQNLLASDVLQKSVPLKIAG